MFRFLLLAASAVLLSFPGYALAEEIVYDRILVKINDDIITQYDLDEEMKPILSKIDKKTLSAREKEQLAQLRTKTLDRMVNDILMAQEIKKYEITIPDSVVDDEIKAMTEERGMTDEEFRETIKKDGLTMEEFREKLKGMIEKQELLGYMVHSKVLVTDTEIQEEYEARREDYKLDKMVTLAILMLPSDVPALEVKERIEDEELTFVEAVSKYSVGPAKEEGGVIGDVEWSDLADDWKTSIEGVAEGAIGSPIVVRGHEALLSPIKIQEDRLIPLEDVRDDIFDRLMEGKRDKIFDEYFKKLKQSSVIEYMD